MVNRMVVRELSKNEKLVLWGLAKYPDLSDNEVYERVGLNKSTFSTIKKRLYEMGYYTLQRVPVLQHLGCELLTVSYAKLSRLITIDERLAITQKLWEKVPTAIFLASESDLDLVICVSKNITQLEHSCEEVTQLYKERKIFERGEFTTILFPFELTVILSLFEFAPLLERLYMLGLDEDVKKNEMKFEKCKHREMSDIEKKIYCGLIKYPNLSDSDLADKISSTRYTVTKMKNEFYDEKLIKNNVLVNLNKLNLGILSLTHSKFNPKKSVSERKKCIELIQRIQTPIFNVTRKSESITLSAYENYEKFQRIHSRVTQFCIKHETLEGDPVQILLSIPLTNLVKNFTYLPLVKNILEI